MRIVNIMGFNIDLNPEGNMLFIINKDTPGVVGKIGSLLGEHNINIASYQLGRVNNNTDAYGVIKLDAIITNDTLSNLEKLDEIVKVWQVNVG